MPKSHGAPSDSSVDAVVAPNQQGDNHNGREMVGGCCVCSEELGWDENPLVYCDGQGCNVAVHQACYGIVSVPTGPWFCRKCESQERHARVRCELCPSRDGALKRTSNGGWAHVVCALYIPEVRFGNVSTMEPIILTLVPQDRYSRVCYICQQQGRESKAAYGACMECNRQGCKQNFHVTCAQSMGLLCEEAGNYLDNVKYCGYCEYHYQRLNKKLVKTIPAYKPIRCQDSLSGSSPESSPHKEGLGSGLLGSKWKKSKKSKRSTSGLLVNPSHSISHLSAGNTGGGITGGSHHSSEVRIEAPRLKLNDTQSNSTCSTPIAPITENAINNPASLTSTESSGGGNSQPSSKEFSFSNQEQQSKSGAENSEESRSHQPAVILKFGKQDNGTYYKKDLSEPPAVAKVKDPAIRRSREQSREDVRMEADSTASEDLLLRDSNKLSAKLSLVETSITPTSSNNTIQTSRNESNNRASAAEEGSKSSTKVSSGSIALEKSKVDLRLSIKVPGSALNAVGTNLGNESVDSIRLVHKSGDVTIESVKDDATVATINREKDSSTVSKFAEPDTSCGVTVTGPHRSCETSSSSVQQQQRGELIIEKAFSPKPDKEMNNSSDTTANKKDNKVRSDERVLAGNSSLKDTKTGLNEENVNLIDEGTKQHKDTNESTNRTSDVGVLQPVKIDLSTPPSKALKLSSSGSKKTIGPSKPPKKGQHIATNPLSQVNERHETNTNAISSDKPAVNLSTTTSETSASTMEANDLKKRRKGPVKRSANGSASTSNSENASWMLGATLNPTSAMAKELNTALQHEIQMHSAYNGSQEQKLVGVPVPSCSSKAAVKMQPVNSEATNGDKSKPPRTLHELLERQWEEGSQFLMEQASHFDIASLLSSLHQLKQENSDLEGSVERLVQRRDHLLAVQARLLTLPAFTFTSSSSSTATTSSTVMNGPSGRSLNNVSPVSGQQHRAVRVSPPMSASLVSPRINNFNHVREQQHMREAQQVGSSLPPPPPRVIESNGLDYHSAPIHSSSYVPVSRRSNSIDSERLPPGAHLLVVANTTAAHPRMMSNTGHHAVSTVSSRYHHPTPSPAGHVGPQHSAGHHYLPSGHSGHRLPPHMSATRPQLMTRGNAPPMSHPFTSAPSNYPMPMHHGLVHQHQHGPPMRPTEPKRLPP